MFHDLCMHQTLTDECIKHETWGYRYHYVIFIYISDTIYIYICVCVCVRSNRTDTLFLPIFVIDSFKSLSKSFDFLIQERIKTHEGKENYEYLEILEADTIKQKKLKEKELEKCTSEEFLESKF